MPADERHIRDLEQVENVAEARFAKSGAPGALDVRVRDGGAAFDGCDFDYFIKGTRSTGAGDLWINLQPPDETSTGVEIGD